MSETIPVVSTIARNSLSRPSISSSPWYHWVPKTFVQSHGLMYIQQYHEKCLNGQIKSFTTKSVTNYWSRQKVYHRLNGRSSPLFMGTPRSYGEISTQIQNQLETWGRAQRKAARCRKSDSRDNFGWFKCRSQQRHLVNQSGKLSEIAPKFHLGGSICATITFVFVDQSSPSFFVQRGRGCSWSLTFPIFDV